MAVTKKAVREIKMNELAKLFGANTGVKVGRACTGKWRGTTDYSVQFDNGYKFFITNGMKRFDERLEEVVGIYKTFNANKDKIVEILKEREAVDNAIAREKEFKEYEILDVTYNKDFRYMYEGWFYVTIKVGDIVKTVMETGLNFAIKNGCLYGFDKMREIMNEERNYFVAGGIREKDVDFIFRGVGFATNDDIYVLR